MRRLEPLVAAQEHRLRQVERGVGGVRGKGDDRLGDRHLVIVESGALGAEQDGVPLARRRDASRAIATLGLRTGFACPRSRAVAA